MTGTFDDWGKSIQLVKNGDVFEKTVELPNSDSKILYKVRPLGPSLVSFRNATQISKQHPSC